MTDRDELQVGDRLYSTCGAEDYGVIVAVGKDANDVPTIDIHVLRPDDLIVQDDDPEFPNFHGLTTLDLGGAKAVLRFVQYRAEKDKPLVDDDPEDTGIRVVCRTPGKGCFRCTQSFYIMRPVPK